MKNTISTLLLLLFVLSVQAQRGLIPHPTATFADVQGQLKKLPQMTTQSVPGSLLVYGNELIEARYRFHQSQLTFAFIDHHFQDREMSKSEINAYIRQLQGEGATVIPVLEGKKVSVHSIFMEGMRFDLVYRELGRKHHKVSLKIQTDLVEELKWASAHNPNQF